MLALLLYFTTLLLFSQHSVNTCTVPSYNLNSSGTDKILYQQFGFECDEFFSGEDKYQEQKMREDQQCQTDTKWGTFFKMNVESSVIHQVTVYMSTDQYGVDQETS